jgi:branched-chain amino acid transport system ATP-binding protein
MLSIEKLQGGYGKKHILHDITMQIGKGEVVSLLGRNGMGKTTSLRTIMGLTPAWSGTIEFDGRSIRNASPNAISRAGIGYVPEGRGIFPNLTVEENLVMAARPGRWGLARVYEREGNWGNQLSGGEQQMLSIGRALMLNPTLMLMDEVTEGLAPLIQQEIWSCLRIISKDGIAILVVDKNIGALLPLVDRHYVIQKGEICWSGTSQALEADRATLDRYITV